jgi:hypothetical protein
MHVDRARTAIVRIDRATGAGGRGEIGANLSFQLPASSFQLPASSCLLAGGGRRTATATATATAKSAFLISVKDDGIVVKR